MLKIGSIVWGVKDIQKEADFWTAALNYEVTYQSIDFAILKPKKGNEGVQMSLKQITSPHARRRHMDLFSDNQKEEVERLLALGATRKKRDYEPDADYVVLEDPDGNPFCVVQK